MSWRLSTICWLKVTMASPPALYTFELRVVFVERWSSTRISTNRFNGRELLLIGCWSDGSVKANANHSNRADNEINPVGIRGYILASSSVPFHLALSPGK